jgi:HD-GYP domain-containing protein (c-di-GMP phosphodiesterase class II)
MEEKRERYSSRIACYNNIYNTSNVPFWVYSNVIDNFMTMLGNVDEYTEYHCFRVATLTSLMLEFAINAQINEEINQLNNLQCKDIVYGAYVHDIGKAQVPSYILRDKEKLTEDEWVALKAHPVNGAFMFLGPGFETIRETILGHHERFDGNGYPMGDCGKQIALGARLVCVCDSLDAMTDKRPYQNNQPLTLEEALVEINKFAETQFDPDIVNILNELVKTKEFQEYWNNRKNKEYLKLESERIKNWLYNKDQLEEKIKVEERNVAVMRKILNIKKS